MTHSRPPMRVTWKAPLPIKTIKIWTAISTNKTIKKSLESKWVVAYQAI
jgi:hypothetical protein